MTKFWHEIYRRSFFRLKSFLPQKSLAFNLKNTFFFWFFYFTNLLIIEGQKVLLAYPNPKMNRKLFMVLLLSNSCSMIPFIQVLFSASHSLG